MKRPTKIGTEWMGEKYKHGPRLHSPKLFSEFRLSRPKKGGVRLVFGKHKKTKKWMLQSRLVPVKEYPRKTKHGKTIVHRHHRKVKRRMVESKYERARKKELKKIEKFFKKHSPQEIMVIINEE